MTPAPRDDDAALHKSLTNPSGTPATPLAARYPWAVFILPFAVFAVVNAIEPAADKPLEFVGWTFPHTSYPLIYTIKIALVMVTMAVLWPGYRQFPLRISPLALLVGAVGAVVWIGLCKLELERRVLELVGLDRFAEFGKRSGFNPLAHFREEPLLAYGFLAVRFWGLAVIVPVIEEFFLRGFIMRYFLAPDWWNVPFGTLNRVALVAGTLTPILTHPTAELFAAAVWFSMVTWLMWRTRNIWDCVVAHMVTNLLLGVWVIARGDWYFL